MKIENLKLQLATYTPIGFEYDQVNSTLVISQCDDKLCVEIDDVQDFIDSIVAVSGGWKEGI